MRTLKRLIRSIPGFRTMKTNSIVIAATYYGAALLILTRYWYWGLALLALPFVIFYLLDLNRPAGRKRAAAVVAAAGAFLLLGTSCGLSAGGLLSARATAAPVPTPSPALSKMVAAMMVPGIKGTIPGEKAAATGAPAVTPTATPTQEAGAPSPTAAPAPVKLTDKEYKYFASRSSSVFHEAGCSSAKRIKPENLIGFKTRDEAIAAGYSPCKRCKP